jgi:Spy/CpxP family protein refolding chaperone
MQKFTVFAAMIGAAMMISSAYAQDAAPAAAPAPAAQPAAPAEDPNEIICHAGEPIVGSRFPGPRICHTRKQWDQIKQDSQEALFHQQMERSANGGK